ncbi:MAG: hypothetical protein DRQ88_07485 [Epsilonproteobacteria bacterium]|nr:MAG: hypothetical protein DRQ89_12360 [Campylobacterota bacterium]RLA66166.1 MAG: hypothetical protein DRQ88_07485 [Campylobacterota bacterium]
MKTLLLAFALLVGTAQAANSPKHKSLGEFVNAEMATQSNYMSDYENISDSELLVDSSFYLNVIRLRIKGSVGLEVPLFASFEIRPMLELRWKRKLPKDMVKYKPKL